jgi:hypothetical protein
MKLLFFVGAVTWAASFASAACADETEPKERFVPWFKERVTIQGGGWFNFPDTDMRINPAVGPEQSLDFESDLGLDDFNLVPWVRASLRFFNRNRIIVEYSESNRSGKRVLAEDIDINGDGTPIPGGVDTSSFYDLRYIRTAYAFSVIKRERLDIAITAGVHFLDIELGVSAAAVGRETVDDETDFSAPLPNVGMEGGWALNDRVAFSGGFSWLQVSTGGLGGGIWTGGLGVGVNIFRNFAVGVRYQFLELNADKKKGSGTKIAVKDFSHGPVIFGALRF